MPGWLFHPLTPLLGMTLVVTLLDCLVVAAARRPMPGLGMMFLACWVYALVAWMDADARRRRHLPCFDFAFLSYCCLPVSLVWYCLWSRGLRGMLTLLFLFGLILVPDIIALIIAIILSPRR